MKGHFNNVRWLIDNWPGDLFFEQGAMNYYFVINGISTILKTEHDQSIFTVTKLMIGIVPFLNIVVTFFEIISWFIGFDRTYDLFFDEIERK